MARGGLGGLTVFLGLDDAEFYSGLSKAQVEAAKFAERLQRDLSDVRDVLKGALAGFTADRLRAFVADAIDAADHLNDLSKKTGIAVDTLGGIGLAAKQAGSDLDSVAGGIGKLNKSIAEAAAGNLQAAEAFKVLGVAVKDSTGQTRSADQILADVADKFASYEDGPEKAALALRIFGKAGADLIPLLDDGGATLQRNIDYFKRYSGVTQEVASQADEFNDTLEKVNLLQKATATTVAAALLPSLQNLAGAYLQVKESGDGFKSVAEGIKAVFDFLVIAASDVGFTFLGLGREIGAVAAQLAELPNAIRKGDFTGFRAISDAVKEDGERARKALDEFQANYRKAIVQVKSVDPADFAVLDQVRPKKGSAPRLSGTGVTDGSAELKKQLEGQLKAIKAFAQQQKDAYDFANRYLQGSFQDGLLSLQDFYAQQKNIRDAGTQAAVASVDKEIAALSAARDKAPKPEDRIDASNKIAEAEQKRAQIIQQASNVNILAQQAEAQAAEQLGDRYNDLLATIKANSGDELGASAIRIAQQVRDAAKTVAQAGQDPGAVTIYKKQLDDLAQLQAAQKEYGRFVDQQRNVEEGLLLAAQRNGTGELETLAAVRDSRKVAIEQLRQMQEAYAAIAAQSGSPEAKKFADDLALALQKAAAEIDPLAQRINDIFENAGTDFFKGILTGAKSAKDAIRDFANTVIGEFANIAAKNLARSIFGTNAGGGGPGIGSLFSQLFGGASSSSIGQYNSGNTSASTVGTSLAVGTNYVPYDGFKATLHKGEAVVPAQYNPSNGRGGGDTVQIVNNLGVQANARAETTTGSDGRQVKRIILDTVAADLGSGTGPTAVAARNRLGTGPGNVPRRG